MIHDSQYLRIDSALPWSQGRHNHTISVFYCITKFPNNEMVLGQRHVMIESRPFLPHQKVGGQRVRPGAGRQRRQAHLARHQAPREGHQRRRRRRLQSLRVRHQGRHRPHEHGEGRRRNRDLQDRPLEVDIESDKRSFNGNIYRRSNKGIGSSWYSRTAIIGIGYCDVTLLCC